MHSTTTGLALTGLDLAAAPSLAALLDRVEQAARKARGGVVLGTGWEEDGWPEGRPPTAAELDRASYGGVVYLARTDVHSAVASSALLAAAPRRRRCSFAATAGQGGGALRVRRVAFAGLHAQPATGRPSARLGSARPSLGIACLHECGGPGIDGEDDFTALLALARTSPVRTCSATGVSSAASSGPASWGRWPPGGDLFADGSLGSRTACLHARYDDEDTTGYAYLTPSRSPRTSWRAPSPACRPASTPSATPP